MDYLLDSHYLASCLHNSLVHLSKAPAYDISALSSATGVRVRHTAQFFQDLVGFGHGGRC